MKKLLVAVGIIAAITFSSATAAQTELTKAPLTWQQVALSNGEELFVDLCAVCHGTQGKGNGPAAYALKKPVPDLTTLAARNDGEFPSQAVTRTILGENRAAAHGSLDMPIWGKAFSDLRPDWKPARREAYAKQRIYDLTAYLETLQAE